MERRIVKQSSKRKKAFIGAIVGTVASVVGGAISAKKKKKADAAQFKLEQDNQTRLEGVNQANAMSAAYGDQGYVDDYNRKITLKAGGRVKYKKGVTGDRVANANKFKLGGRKKAAIGGAMTVGSEVAAGIGGVGSLASAILSKPAKPKMLKVADGFTFGQPKTAITPNSYQTDELGQPITDINNMAQPIGINTNTMYKNNPMQAKFGTKRKVKTITKSK